MTFRNSLAALILAAAPTLASAQPSATPPPAWRPGMAGDLAFETSGFLRATAYTASLKD